MRQFDVYGKKVKVNTQSLDKLFGEFDRHLYTITLDKGLDEHTKQITLLHELIHAILHRTSIHIELSDELEELICDNIAKCFCENFNFELE